MGILNEWDVAVARLERWNEAYLRARSRVGFWGELLSSKTLERCLRIADRIARKRAKRVWKELNDARIS